MYVLNVYTPKFICGMFRDIELAIALENFEPKETVDARYKYTISLHPILSKAYICMISSLDDSQIYCLLKDLPYDKFMLLFREIARIIDYNTPLGDFPKFKWNGV